MDDDEALAQRMKDRGAARVFEIDGAAHYVPGRTACNCSHHRSADHYPVKCPQCGGYRHFEGVYYGAIYVCEDCGNSD